jgi:hypothetical protein
METIAALVACAVIVLIGGIVIHAAYRIPGGSAKTPK